MKGIKAWVNNLNPKVYHSSGESTLLSDEELHREARRALAARGIRVEGPM